MVQDTMLDLNDRVHIELRTLFFESKYSKGGPCCSILLI
jgi:hypothetical protein